MPAGVLEGVLGEKGLKGGEIELNGRSALVSGTGKPSTWWEGNGGKEDMGPTDPVSKSLTGSYGGLEDRIGNWTRVSQRGI